MGGAEIVTSYFIAEACRTLPSWSIPTGATAAHLWTAAIAAAEPDGAIVGPALGRNDGPIALANVAQGR